MANQRRQKDKIKGSSDPDLDKKVDVHIFVLPSCLWRPDLRFAYNSICVESISCGFLRALPSITLDTLRDEISQQMDCSLLPSSFVFLRSIGKCLTWVTEKQEKSLKLRLYLPPLAPCPEIYILDAACLQLQMNQKPPLPPLQHTLAMPPHDGTYDYSPGFMPSENDYPNTFYNHQQQHYPHPSHGSHPHTCTPPSFALGKMGTTYVTDSNYNYQRGQLAMDPAGPVYKTRGEDQPFMSATTTTSCRSNSCQSEQGHPHGTPGQGHNINNNIIQYHHQTSTCDQTQQVQHHYLNATEQGPYIIHQENHCDDTNPQQMHHSHHQYLAQQERGLTDVRDYRTRLMQQKQQQQECDQRKSTNDPSLHRRCDNGYLAESSEQASRGISIEAPCHQSEHTRHNSKTIAHSSRVNPDHGANRCQESLVSGRNNEESEEVNSFSTSYHQPSPSTANHASLTCGAQLADGHYISRYPNTYEPEAGGHLQSDHYHSNQSDPEHYNDHSPYHDSSINQLTPNIKSNHLKLKRQDGLDSEGATRDAEQESSKGMQNELDDCHNQKNSHYASEHEVKDENSDCHESVASHSSPFGNERNRGKGKGDCDQTVKLPDTIQASNHEYVSHKKKELSSEVESGQASSDGNTAPKLLKPSQTTGKSIRNQKMEKSNIKVRKRLATFPPDGNKKSVTKQSNGQKDEIRKTKKPPSYSDESYTPGAGMSVLRRATKFSKSVANHKPDTVAKAPAQTSRNDEFSRQIPLPPIGSTTPRDDGKSSTVKKKNSTTSKEMNTNSKSQPNRPSTKQTNEILAQIRTVKEECELLSSNKAESSSTLRTIQHDLRTQREAADKEWKRKFFQEKKFTSTLEDRIKKARDDLQQLQVQLDKKHGSHLKDSFHTTTVNTDAPSELSNMKIRCKKNQALIQNVRAELEAAKKRLTAERNARKSLENECKDLRRELLKKKIACTRTKRQPVSTQS